MKEINVDSHNVPATARSKNYQTALATTAASGGGATMPSVVTPTGGAADTAKVAQNLAEDSTDWAKILRKDIDERTENALSIGKNLTVDGQALLNDVVANTGTFGGLLKAAAVTITGALLASTVSATTMNATTFIGELQGNAATATRLQTPRTIWGKNFDGSGDVNGTLYTSNGLIVGEQTYSLDGVPIHGVIMGHTLYNSWNFGEYGGQYNFYLSNSTTDNARLIARIDTNNNYLSGNLGIGTTTPQYKLDVNGNMRVTSGIYADATVGTRNFASHTTGWRADSNGNADFRNIYADELRVQAFTADISQALAGSDYLTKSVSKLSANFVVPAVNSTVRIIVDDIEGMPATQCFVNGDYIRFRAFNRNSGLTIANVWGTVTLDTSYGSNGFLNGTQAYTFTCTQTTGAGLTVFKGSEVLDYGTSGSGLIARTTLDAMGSPYEQIATWVNDPSNGNNYTVHARLGNLNGIANCNGYGIYTDNGFFTGKIVIGDLTKTANFLSFDSENGLQIKLGGTSVATTTDVTTAVNGIQVGGRNLLKGTRLLAGSSFNGWVAVGSTVIANDYSSFTSVSNSYTSNSSGYCDLLSWGNVITPTPNTYYVLSFYAKSTVEGDTITSYFYPDTQINIGDGSTDTTLTTEWAKYVVTWHTKSDISGVKSIIVARLTNGKGTGTVSVCGVKLEEGNKATDWTPAPEDVDANIATAQSTAITTAASNAAALYVTQSAYSSQVSILQNSINAKVSQTDFNALGTRVGTAESNITQNANAITTKVSQTDYTGNTIASLINQTATTVTIQASKINLVGAVTIGAIDKSSVTPEALGAATPTDVNTAVDNIQIGGRNLLLNSKTSKSGTSYNIGYWTSSRDFIVGETLTVTIKGSISSSKLFGIWFNEKYIGGYPIPKVSDGIFSTVISVPSGTSNRIVGIYLGGNQSESDSWTFEWIKLECGNKATDWTPAPEDVDASINGIHIGGRNLFISGSANTKLVTISGSGDGSNEAVNQTDIHAYLQAGVQYIFSLNTDGAWGGINGTDTVEAFLLKDNTYNTYYHMDSNVQIFTPSVSGTYYLRLDINQNNKSHWFSEIQIEEGNKKTAWTPAPEDVSQDAQNKVDELSRAHGGLTYLDAHSIYTGTLTANQVNAVGIDAGSITVGTLNADRIDAVNVVAKGLVAQKVQAATLQTIHNSGEAYVDIHNGIIDVYGTVARNIQFGVNDQGMAVLKYFNNDGINLYDLGPNGLDSKNLQTAQWEEIQYVRVLSIMQTVPPNGLVSDENASVLFRLNTTWDLTTLYRYHAGKINNTIVSDSANGFTTAADAAAADGKFFTVKSSGYLANDTYTNNNGSHMSTGSNVMKEYWVIQNGVSTRYLWRCSLETFNMINGNY